MNLKTSAGLDSHFKQWQGLGERISAFAAPILRMQEAMQKSLAPIIEARTAIDRGLGHVLAEKNRWAALMESIKVPESEVPQFQLHDLSELTRLSGEFRRNLQGLLSPAVEEFQRSFVELPPQTREALLVLGVHGWYLDLDMPLSWLWKLKRALLDGNAAEAEEALVEHLESRLDEIERSIAARFPRRAHLIRAAFNAHRRQEYELSIPVLLAQVDGICKDAIDQYFFIKDKKKPRTAIYVEQIAADTFKGALLSPLSRTLPINASEKERPEANEALNRHAVLHGESVDYGTKTNGLKAISLINYVAHVLEFGNERALVSDQPEDTTSKDTPSAPGAAPSPTSSTSPPQ